MAWQETSLKEKLFLDLDRELQTTRRVLDRLPEEQYGWKPHEKSMSLGRLAAHVAELPSWATDTLRSDELNFANMRPMMREATSRQQLLERFDSNVAELRRVVEQFDPGNWDKPWTMRNGDQIIVTKPRSLVYRVWSLNHLIHHRAQLCLYLRLLNVPVPTIYFNTADNPEMIFE